ncbi:uncharacterized protein C8Q71DRAFT_706307 [Rhodofomes roseus]|uniref:Uncharacterized protein n=1 Tax=Rhodofomes roseus TaxID=34475 RepID=A0ABQ8KK57_9APHY|nr:uncharacterized protein C8Q71DRAFT_706307 [Rhodofomes roseus]KAH9837878.1 hypothetical protein C8Q71DRAFT_706307 [Rhodofomes roseus]
MATKRETFLQLAVRLGQDTRALSTLLLSWNDRYHKEALGILDGHLRSLGATSEAVLGKDPFSGFVSLCVTLKDDVPLIVVATMKKRKAGQQHYRKVHRRLVEDLGLRRMDNDVRMANLRAIAYEICLPRLCIPYPDHRHWVYETPEVEALWRPHIEAGPLPDKRMKRLPMLAEDISQLAHIVPKDKSAIIYDSATGQIAVAVIRNFCGDQQVVDWAGDVVGLNASLRRNVRKGDPGTLVCIGYTAGSRSSPCFVWTHNTLSKKHPPEYLKSLECRTASVCSLSFNMMCGRLPDAITQDFEDFLAEHKFCRMDGNGEMAKKGSTRGTYCVEKAGEFVEFHNAELAPPAAFMGANYARYVSMALQHMAVAMHAEHQPHRYAYSWTTNRNLNEDEGGNFYVASYGVKVCMAPNTFIAWCPRDVHGTSLMKRDPGRPDPPFAQWGLSVATSSRLPGIWKKYRDGIISAEQAAKEWEETLEDDLIDDDK